MQILLVEDDEFKASDVSKLVEETIIFDDIIRASSVTIALRFVTDKIYDLIILDMSLPTFDLSGPGGGGSPQGQGGIEVLRLVSRLKRRSKIIVVTQYPDIELDGRSTDLDDAAKLLSQKFSLEVLACVPYEFDGQNWKKDLQSALRKI